MRSSAQQPKPNPRRRRARLITSAVAAALMAAVAVLAVPSPAQADDLPVGAYSCSDFPDVTFVRTGGSGWFYSWQGYRGYELVSATPTFDIAYSRTAQNLTDTAGPVTFTASQSITVSTTVTMGGTVSFLGLVSRTVSASVTQSQTSTVGVSYTATVPPHSSVIGEYGIHAYDVVFTAQGIGGIGTASRPLSCIVGARMQGTGHAATTSEGWRVRPL